MFSCLSEYVQEVEMFSIDEAFVLLPPFGENDEISYHLYVEFVQKKIFKRTGIPVTFGVAPTRLLAKTFAKLRKPYGVYVGLEESTILSTLKDLAITKTPFIGERMASKVPEYRTMLEFMQ